MARIAGVDLPAAKRAEIGLTYIYGVGRTRSRSLLYRAGIDFDKKIRDLSEDEVNKARQILKEEGDGEDIMAKAAAKAPAKGGKKKSFKKKEKRVVHSGIVHIQATFNNTIVTIADQEGHTIAWSSAGSLGFRGSRKGTPFAAQQAAMTAANKASESGLRTVEVRVSGPGSGRESAVRALSTAGIEVRQIKDVTPIPHNGCRPPQKRRGK